MWWCCPLCTVCWFDAVFYQIQVLVCYDFLLYVLTMPPILWPMFWRRQTSRLGLVYREAVISLFLLDTDFLAMLFVQRVQKSLYQANFFWIWSFDRERIISITIMRASVRPLILSHLWDSIIKGLKMERVKRVLVDVHWASLDLKKVSFHLIVTILFA